MCRRRRALDRLHRPGRADDSLHDLDPATRHFLRIIATSIDLQPALFRNAEPPAVQQLDVVIGKFACFNPGDDAFSVCE